MLLKMFFAYVFLLIFRSSFLFPSFFSSPINLEITLSHFATYLFLFQRRGPSPIGHVWLCTCLSLFSLLAKSWIYSQCSVSTLGVGSFFLCFTAACILRLSLLLLGMSLPFSAQIQTPNLALFALYPFSHLHVNSTCNIPCLLFMLQALVVGGFIYFLFYVWFLENVCHPF